MKGQLENLDTEPPWWQDWAIGVVLGLVIVGVLFWTW